MSHHHRRWPRGRATRRLLAAAAAAVLAAWGWAAGCEAASRGQQQAGRSLRYTETPVGQIDVAPDAWSRLLRENLEPDLAPWRARGPLAAASVPQLQATMLQRYPSLESVLRLVLVYNNRLYWPNRQDANGTGPPHPSSPHMMAFHQRLSPLLASGRLKLPNTLFLLNVEDNWPRLCGPDRCAAPALSLIKTVGEPDGDDSDILIPQMLFVPGSLYHVPWHLKKDAAYFRGTPFCSGYWYRRFPSCIYTCPRTYLAWRSHDDAVRNRTPAVLDVALVEPYPIPWKGKKAEDGRDKECMPEAPPVVPRTPVAEHSTYKWLLHLEGISASSRLSQLFMTNSLVLFQRQPFIEYFYRSLKPWVHYVPFWNGSSPGAMDDVYDVVAALRRREAEAPEALQAIVREAQGFATRFTTPPARLRYLSDALSAYTALFADMGPFLEAHVAGLRGRGFTIP